ncbi:MAG: outer membrane lipoprotein-sorting protein, partial [Bdellovibrionota bacterium]
LFAEYGHWELFVHNSRIFTMRRAGDSIGDFVAFRRKQVDFRRMITMLLIWTNVALADLGPREVMVKNEEARKVKNSFASAVLTTATKAGKSRTKKFSWWRRLNPDGERYNTLTRFHEPAEIAGEGVLFLEHAKGATSDEEENEVQMYLPNFKKVRLVESQQQSGSFMGSDFSYSDISTQKIDDFKYEMKSTDEACGADARYYQIEAIPAREAVLDRSGYSKMTLWIQKGNFMQARGEYYDRDSKLVKKMVASEIREVDPAAHKWLAHHLTMENVQKGRTTTLLFTKVDVTKEIPASTFTVLNLARE